MNDEKIFITQNWTYDGKICYFSTANYHFETTTVKIYIRDNYTDRIYFEKYVPCTLSVVDDVGEIDGQLSLFKP